MTYVGPVSRLDPSAAFSLGDAWAYQPKLDGVYARAVLDDTGRVASVAGRNKRPLREADELLGILAGPPRSVLVGELEAHTEAGAAAFARQGYRRLHLFDCLCLDGEVLADLPYLERWGALHRGQSILEGEGRARVITWEWRGDQQHYRHHRRRPFDLATNLLLSMEEIATRPPNDLRRFPIVPLLRSPTDARELWRSVESGDLEGLVAVDLRAPAGKRDAKRKIKITDTIDAKVLASSGRVLHVATRSGTTQQAWRDRPTFTVQSRAGEAPGSIVEVAHHGYYKSGEPRFARVVRERKDIT